VDYRPTFNNILLEVEFYNEANDEFLKGSVAICFAFICFRYRTHGIPELFVKASKLNAYVYINPFSLP